MNFLSIPLCAKGVAKFFAPAAVEHSHTWKDWGDPFDSPTTDALPDFAPESESDSDGDINTKILQGTTIETWRPNLFEMVRPLQKAPANKGCVDLMKSLKHGGRLVAVKRMPRSWVTASPEEFARRRPESTERPWVDIGIVRYLHERRFANICDPLGVFSDGYDTYVVNSFANGGELFSWLDGGPNPGPEREVIVRPIMKQLLLAVMHLHNMGIAHRDISVENVMLSDDGDGLIVKLIDFGQATTNRHVYELSGKRSYMAPEMRQDGPYDVFLSDAFAVGVTLFSVACREYPWNSTAPGACKLFSYVAQHGLQKFLSRKKVYGRDEKLAEVVSEPLAELLAGLFQVNPANRFSLGEKCWADEEAVPRRSVWDVEW